MWDLCDHQMVGHCPLHLTVTFIIIQNPSFPFQDSPYSVKANSVTTTSVWLVIFNRGWGVLHCHSFIDDDETYQLILPQWFCDSVLRSLHDGNGHQGLQQVVELLCAKVYWPSMFGDTDHWLSQCKRCHIAKGDYIEPKTQQGSLVTHQPLELLCVDFTKADIAKGGQREYPCSHRCFFQIQSSLCN